MRRHVWASSVLIVGIVGMGVACGGSTSEPIPESQSPESRTGAPAAVQVTVGKTGGAVTNTEGSGVEIPAGAVPNDVDVSVKAAPSSTPTPTASETVGTPYVFGPSGIQFAKPVTIVLAFDPTKLPTGTKPSDIVVFTAPDGTANYQPLKTSLRDATHVAAETTHFSIFVPVIPPPTLDAGSSCTPLKCSPGVCGPVANGCGGTLDCGKCAVDADGGDDGGATPTGPEKDGGGSTGGDPRDGGAPDKDGGPIDPIPTSDAGAPPDKDGGTSDPRDDGGPIDPPPPPDSGAPPDKDGGTSDPGDPRDDGGPTEPPPDGGVWPDKDGGACTPVLCGHYGPGACGMLPDNCGQLLDCGTCHGDPPPDSDAGTCMPLTCANHIDSCGSFHDGCGGKLECQAGCNTDGGPAPSSDAGPAPSSDAGGCEPKMSCTPDLCGPIYDGCQIIDCKAGCGTSSDAGGPPPREDAGGCVPKTCAMLPGACGVVPDGCGKEMDCGKCGGDTCVPRTCLDYPQACGDFPDTCGKLLSCREGCNEAPPDAGSQCVPKTCAQLPPFCGPAPDGCGGVIDCRTSCP